MFPQWNTDPRSKDHNVIVFKHPSLPCHFVVWPLVHTLRARYSEIPRCTSRAERAACNWHGVRGMWLTATVQQHGSYGVLLACVHTRKVANLVSLYRQSRSETEPLWHGLPISVHPHAKFHEIDTIEGTLAKLTYTALVCHIELRQS